MPCASIGAGNSRKAGVDDATARPSAFFIGAGGSSFNWRSAMSATEYEQLDRVIMEWEDVEAMRRDRTIIVVMAIPIDEEGWFEVTFLSREGRDLPPWIIDRKAA
jgi:hypothetical protein